ncbi:hypothetical protein [Streptococcus agalactiae]|uniref:Uncharacterized protein n=1 Tax=Streptococcus agalactiae MRI Z1-216 TaxID=1154879 RepID=A0AAD3A4E3_STRAG|nr:hypothetical protein [Streptococcus agalactiae]EPU31250.1 hypothetical protein SAG0161_00465 [Streptococcus agalactiae MRI Z1-213]EPU36773.1 hypothetical protein SAG0162_05770 [Streptococcus agalactiae MRI Z1-214]EPU39631.1 hypothetical protein SAG0164_06270 [Streptococcus agalactiae MRI Z1-216]EPX08842.1 hypothetical protein SAG0165_07330 [Streptococcus agalactiae MRI Z1-217]
MTKNYIIRGIPENVYVQLQMMAKEQGYRSLNAFMLAQIERIVKAGGLDLYDNQFAESLVDIKEQQAQILELLLKNEMKLQYANLKQDTVEELTTMWLNRFMDK